MRTVPIAALVLLLFAATAHALEVGDKAPPLEIAEWVVGEPIDPSDPEGESVTVVEFWATWCAPCKVTIPHLNELHAALEDEGLRIVGISREPVEKVKPFAEEMEMKYRVAVDDADRTSAVYMEGVPGIPHAFVVDRDGVVVWQGHPMDNMEDVVRKVLAGAYEPTPPTEEERAVAAAEAELREAFSNNDVAAGLEAARELIELQPQSYDRFALLVQILAYQRDKEGLRRARRDAAERFEDNPQNLNRLAWEILTEADLTLRDLDLALSCARRAAALTQREDAAILDTLARAYYELGAVERALATQEAAVAAATDEPTRANLAQIVAYYENVKKLRDALD
jgi:peroxiredoxin